MTIRSINRSVTARAQGWADDAMFSPQMRAIGLIWVTVSLPFIIAVAGFATTPDRYVFVLVFLASGAYTTPALVAAVVVVRYAPQRDRLAYILLMAGLTLVYAVGLGMLAGLVTDWEWGNEAVLPVIVLSALAHCTGLTLLARSRSGRRALSVDVIEALIVVLAVAAPLALLWGPAVVNADASWFTVPSAVIFVFTLWGVYWAFAFRLRLGSGYGAFELSALVLAALGALDALLNTAHGVSGFTLPPAPLIGLHALCFSAYLLLPLNVPTVVRPGLDGLPPQAQVRRARVPGAVTLAGLATLLIATAITAGERSWAVPYTLVVASLLCALSCLHQLAVAGETRRLYQLVEAASNERQQLLAQLVEHAADDRRRFADQMYGQAVAAYTSFRVLAGAGGARVEQVPSVLGASALVGDDLARQADSVRSLVKALRQESGQGGPAHQWVAPIQAYLRALYGDERTPDLTVKMTAGISPSWVVEAILMQITQEALHNVWSHSRAGAVRVTVEAADDSVVLQVQDDGVGFDVASTPEGRGIATMREAAAVVGGGLSLDAQPGKGVTVRAHLGAGEAEDGRDDPDSPDLGRPPLRLVT